MDAEDPNLRERLVGLKLQRDELATEIGEFRRRLTGGEPTISPEKITRFGELFQNRLDNGPSELRQAYA